MKKKIIVERERVFFLFLYLSDDNSMNKNRDQIVQSWNSERERYEKNEYWSLCVCICPKEQ